MDDLLALMDGASDDDNSINEESPSPFIHDEVKAARPKNNHANNRGAIPYQSSVHSASSSAKGSIDPLTKIRLVNRLTSSVDLVDKLAPFQFHTCVMLASMTKAQLSTIITQPSNNGEVSGKTNSATMGIVFSNSGTRMSKTGRAFSILTLGDLSTGPTVSVFLFGHVYSQFTTKIKPGMVVAILAGSLMPQRAGGETRISLSLNDIQQIVLAGKAMDYGTCAGMTRDNRKGFQRGQQSNQVKCKNYVDVRVGKFCSFHAKQQLQNQNKHVTSASRKRTGIKNVKNMTFVQSLRADKAVRKGAMSAFHSSSGGNSNQAPSNVMTMVLPGQGTVVTHNPNASNIQTSMPQRGGLGSNALRQSLAQSMLLNPGGTRISRDNTIQSLTRAPKHMKLSSNPVVNTKRPSVRQKVHNPYAKKQNAATIISSNASANTKSTSTKDILGQALLGSSHTHNERKINSHTPLTTPQTRRRNLVHMEGMNGQVQVPKPNALFRKTTPNPHQLAPCTYAMESQTVTPSPQQRSAVLDRQRQVAERLRNNSANKTNTAATSTTDSKKSNENKSNLDNLLGLEPLSDEKRASVLETTSKYSREAKAENYAKSRRVLGELEKKEAVHDKKQERKNNAANSKKGDGIAGSSIGSAIIVSEFKCVTCNKITQFKPIQCIRQNHKVKRKREIKKRDNSRQKRIDLKSRSVEDGGLVLGSGLEWSRFGG